VGNRTQSIIDGVTTQYTYDANDRLTQQGGVSYSYDAQGNTLTETEGAIVSKTYSYNSQQELVSLMADDGASQATTIFSYGPDGIRTGKEEGGNTTQFTIDYNRDYAQVLKETTATDTVTYTYGDDLLSQERSSTSTPSFFLYDGLGSTRALADSTGNLTDSYDYVAFGELLNETGTTENSYRYTGEQFDASLDQYYLRARYYNQGVGRFTQMDSWLGEIYDPDTLHKYLYTSSEPVNNIDPSGYFLISDTAVAQNVMNTLGAIAIISASSQLDGLLALASPLPRLGEDRQLTTTDLAISRWKVRRCQRSGSTDCSARFPIIILGNDGGENTRHVFDSLVMGRESSLMYVTRWNWKPGEKPECKGKTFKGSGFHCDEYPFGSSLQGGPLNYPDRVSLRPINDKHNSRAGQKLGQFYRECGVAKNDPLYGWFGVLAALDAPLTRFVGSRCAN
jgi:RHS repeat-associated protein